MIRRSWGRGVSRASRLVTGVTAAFLAAGCAESIRLVERFESYRGAHPGVTVERYSDDRATITLPATDVDSARSVRTRVVRVLGNLCVAREGLPEFFSCTPRYDASRGVFVDDWNAIVYHATGQERPDSLPPTFYRRLFPVEGAIPPDSPRVAAKR